MEQTLQTSGGDVLDYTMQDFGRVPLWFEACNPGSWKWLGKKEFKYAFKLYPIAKRLR